MSSESYGLAIARTRIADEAVAQTGSLDLGGLGLTLVPPGLLDLMHLKSLDLGRGWSRREREMIGPNQVASWLGQLSALTQLEELSLGRTDCASLGFTATLPRLKTLDCRGTAVTDLGPLAGLPNLAGLNISDTRVIDLAPLAGLALQAGFPLTSGWLLLALSLYGVVGA
jgi:internalin A